MQPQDDSMDDHTLEQLEQAELLKMAGKYHEAITLLEEILLTDPENVAALEEIADNELSLGRYERAEAAASQAVAFDDSSYTAEYILGFLRSREAQWTNAVAHLRASNQLKPNNAEILRCLGWALFNGGEHAQGVVTLERALNLDPDSTLTLCDLGVAYLELKQYSKARALFERALDLDPKSARAKECLQAVERLLKVAKK
jgi:tetratricopeptide (TPR) repeat protein